MNYEIDQSIINRVNDKIKEELDKIDELCEKNSLKVLKAFKNNNINETDFNSTTGYGYNDLGRDSVERVYSDIFGSEDSLVRNQFISGTHALTVALFGLLRPNDLMLSVSGKPYDTLDEVIGIKENKSSLKSFGICYDQIDLIDDDFDYEKIKEYLTNTEVKVLYVQRSKGYSTRKSISIEKLEKLVKTVREVNENQIIMIDNCYCEFVEEKSPIEVGVDIIIGSLIKNLGAGIASNGAYISGKKKYIELISERLTTPGQGKEVGPTLGANKEFLKGIFFAPSVVASALKTAIFTSALLEEFDYKVEPKYNDKRVDIVQNIIFENRDDLIKYCQAIQSYSPIDSNVLPIPSDMPGYDDQIIMASGSFTQGSSIELSCDGPLRPPFIAYQQGSLTYQYGKIAVIHAASTLIK